MTFEEFKENIKNDFELNLYKLYLEEKKPKKKLISQLSPIMFSALLGLLGTGVGVYLQGKASMELEEKKIHANLILKMVDVNDKKQAAANLEFLINTGLISNPVLQKSIDSIIRNRGNIPTIGISDYQLTDEVVKTVQEELKYLGYYKGVTDGLQNNQLTEAVKKFQQENNMPPDGSIGPATFRNIQNVYKDKIDSKSEDKPK